MSNLTSRDHVSHDDDWVDIRLTSEEYEEIFNIAQMLTLAEMINYRTAQAALPKLVKAVEMVLAIENETSTPAQVIQLSRKTRAILQDALKAAGLGDH
jgi:hypothetical protein